MASKQVPTWLGVGVLVVGTPFILMDAASTSRELNALNAEQNAPDALVNMCMERTAHLMEDSPMHERVCECIVDKATARGALDDFGGYDEAKLEPITSECLRGDWD